MASPRENNYPDQHCYDYHHHQQHYYHDTVAVSEYLSNPHKYRVYTSNHWHHNRYYHGHPDPLETHSQVAVVIEDTLFVHGGISDVSINFVPDPLHLRYFDRATGAHVVHSPFEVTYFSPTGYVVSPTGYLVSPTGYLAQFTLLKYNLANKKYSLHRVCCLTHGVFCSYFSLYSYTIYPLFYSNSHCLLRLSCWHAPSHTGAG